MRNKKQLILKMKLTEGEYFKFNGRQYHTKKCKDIRSKQQTKVFFTSE